MSELVLICCNGPEGPTYLIGQEADDRDVHTVDETGGLGLVASATLPQTISLRAPLIALLVSVEKINDRVRFLKDEKDMAIAQKNGDVCSLPQLLPEGTILCSIADPTDYVNTVYEVSTDRLISRLPISPDSILGVAYDTTIEMLDDTDSHLVKTIRSSQSLDIKHILRSLADPDKRRQVQYTNEAVD